MKKTYQHFTRPFRAMLLAVPCIALAEESYTPGHPDVSEFPEVSEDFLEYYCYDCHGDGVKKGGFSMDDLTSVDETNIDTWKSIWAQVAIQEMPPKDEEQPEILEALKFTDGILQQLESVTADKGGFHAHKEPRRGNFLSHDLLFSEKLPQELTLLPPSSPKRLWRMTPEEYITRLNELINTEPEYDPNKPGLRTHGDAVALNHGGELKLYFGVDRITTWAGGTVAYATAVKAVPAVLSSARKHGFDNYAHFSSINDAESMQILNKANDLLRYMAHGPMSLVSMPEQITDDIGEYFAEKPPGDIRGLPSALTFNTEFIRPESPLHEVLRDHSEIFSDDEIRRVIEHLFEMLTFRPPLEQEVEDYLVLVRDTLANVPGEDGLILGLTSLFLDRDALFRPELAEAGEPDDYGRTMLRDWELGLAVNHAFAYIKPDDTLRSAIVEHRMRTRDDVRREVTRILNDDSIRKPRILQFFRDYFDYDLGAKVCKDEKALRSAGVDKPINGIMLDANRSMDRLVEHILADDRDVLKRLLTTHETVLSKDEHLLYGQLLSESELQRKTPKKTNKKVIRKPAVKTLAKAKPQTGAVNGEKTKKPSDKTIFNDKNLPMEERIAAYKRFAAEKHGFRNWTKRVPALTAKRNRRVQLPAMPGQQVQARVGYLSFGKDSDTPERLLTTMPKEQRLGILTTPAWLVSHSDAMDNHAIHRGIWIREKLLGGGIPDVPITVDAQLPDEPGTTLRSRMRVTRETYCWSCHEKMDPLGLPFEMFNHAGLYRKEEFGLPVDTSGEIIDSGDPTLDGPVTDALDMITKLANSEHVEQVFVRHAFRYWMGRNETIHDRPVLQAAHEAYRTSGGSMKALLTSLLTSDAFLYRAE